MARFATMLSMATVSSATSTVASSTAATSTAATSTTPTVSVLTAVYNGERYLREALDSILAQTFEDFELIVIDDGSSDSTPEILAEYAARDARIRVTRNTTNLRLIASLNKAVSLARGEFLARQDDDDLSLPSRFEEQVGFLRAHPEVGLLGTSYYRLYSDGEKVLRHPPRADAAIRWKMLFGNIWCHGTMMFRRALLDAEPVAYGDFLHAEDYELWNRLLRRTRAATLAKPQVVYRVHGESICVQNSDVQAEMTERISGQLLRELAGEPLLTDGEVSALRRMRAPTSHGATREDLEHAAAIFRVLEGFARREGLGGTDVQLLEAAWLRRLLREVPVYRWGQLARSGVLARALRAGPADVLKAPVRQALRSLGL